MTNIITNLVLKVYLVTNTYSVSPPPSEVPEWVRGTQPYSTSLAVMCTRTEVTRVGELVFEGKRYFIKLDAGK